MRNNRKAATRAVGCDQRMSAASSRPEAARGPMESPYGPACPGVETSADTTIWEHTLGRQISEARSACLQGLTRIPTGLGKLAYLALLQHRLLEDHEELFGEWRCCSRQQKYEWLYRLLAGASHSGTLPDEWLSHSTYSDLVPRSAKKAARMHYLTDIEAVLEILRKELAGLSGHPEPETH